MKYNIYYLTSDLDNDKPKYVGITINSLQKRLCAHRSDSKKSNAKVYTWMKNRVLHNYEIKIKLVETIETNDPYFWEDFYIYLFNSWGFNLTNLLYSGYSSNVKFNRGKMSNQAKEKLSKLYTGIKLNKERIEKSKKNKIRISLERGYFLTKEHKQNISKALTGKVVSDAEKKRLKEIRKLVTPRVFPILCLNLLTNKVEYYESITNFAKCNNVKRTNVQHVLANKRNKVGNWYVCYLNSTCPIKTL